ncbi:Uncharacterised protein [Vibrio cincinnatiensis]|nr:Uncharacterised protein [Vibrio cincinnatiensis]
MKCAVNRSSVSLSVKLVGISGKTAGILIDEEE